MDERNKKIDNVPKLENNFELKDLIIFWNNQYPFDYIWRKKYKIAFNSPQHREMNLIDIKLDLLEEQLIQESLNIMEERKENKENYLITGIWLNKKSGKSISEEDFFNYKL